MTAAVLPDFVLRLLEVEISKVNMVFLEKIADKYNLDKAEILQMMKESMTVALLPSDEEKIKIISKRVTKMRDPSERCIAVTFNKNEIEVKQCSRRFLDGFDFCKTHLKLFQEKRLKYGTIRDNEKPKEIAPAALKKVVKRNIY